MQALIYFNACFIILKNFSQMAQIILITQIVIREISSICVTCRTSGKSARKFKITSRDCIGSSSIPSSSSALLPANLLPASIPGDYNYP